MIYVHKGFARGHYTRHAFRVKLARVTVGPNCHGGISLQLHRKGVGIHYVDFVLWKWRPWLARMGMIRNR